MPPELCAAAIEHEADIVAMLKYRARIEALRPVTVEPLSPVDRQTIAGRLNNILSKENDEAAVEALAAELLEQHRANPAISFIDEAKAASYFRSRAISELARRRR